MANDVFEPLPPQQGLTPTEEDRTWGMLAHLSPFLALIIGFTFVGPLVIWLIYKDKSAFIADQAKESLNFQLAVWVASLVLAATCIGVLLLPIVGVGAIIYQIIAAMEANKGIAYRYPYNIRFIS